LSALQDLFLGGNKLTALPPEMANLSNLRKLALSANPQLNFAAAFSILSSLTKLQTLNLSGNQLETIPPEIAKLSMLEVLVLSGNKLSPEEQEKVQKLLPNCEIKF
jgi:Leucine-rich repeat (LRR) protein